MKPKKSPQRKGGPYPSLRPLHARCPDLFHPIPKCPLYFHLKPEFSLPRLFSYDSRTPVYFQSIPEAHVIFTPSRNKNLGSSENKTENKKETLEDQGFPKVVILWGFGDGHKIAIGIVAACKLNQRRDCFSDCVNVNQFQPLRDD